MPIYRSSETDRIGVAILVSRRAEQALLLQGQETFPTINNRTM